MDLPQSFIDSLTNLPEIDLAAFLRVHAAGEKVTSLRINPNKTVQAATVLQPLLPAGGVATQVPWSSYGYYLPARPSFTFDPLFHAGAYYVQEASSMFLEQVLKQACDLSAPVKVLDLCAAPGGKSTLLQSLINAESLLVSNEVIKARAALLVDNLTKWGAANVVVTNNDPRDFSRLPGFFDVMVVDAPCSGSGLFRREPEAAGEWSPENVILCSQRQQRILADAMPALKDGGVLIYATCSYSKEEDEEIMTWLNDNFELENIPIPLHPSWHIVKTAVGERKLEGYRFYPDKLQGEGFFITCFRRKRGDVYTFRKQKEPLNALPKKELSKVDPWLSTTDGYFFMEHNGEVLAFPEELAPAVNALQQQLYLRKAGVKLGQLSPRELIPDHQLAMSTLLSTGIATVDLDKEQALHYLRKEDPAVETGVKGWALMRYGQMPLGWAKILPNRMNNYYPKELRILKEI